MNSSPYDVIIIGGGPAGSSAALILGRSRLNVLLIDNAKPRNIRATGVHGLLTRDGLKPLEMRRIGHEEVLSVGVQLEQDEATGLECRPDGFHVELSNGRSFLSRRIVLATGLCDQIPDVEGMDRLYGTSVHHCPFCDGWEVRDKGLGILASGPSGVNSARGLLTWSSDVILFTNGTALRRADLKKAREAGIEVRTTPVVRLNGKKHLESIELVNGEMVARDALFFDSQPEQHCGLAVDLGCITSRSGAIRTDKRQRTNVQGLYVIGDAAADPNMVVIAMADGVKAALNIVQQMQKEGHWLPKNEKSRE